MVKRSKSYRRKSHRRKSSYRLMGGSGAAEYAQHVYGSPSEQHAISNTDNQIYMNKMGGGNVTMPIVGGNPKIGGFGMADAIVPAGFLIADTMYSRSIGRRVDQGVGRVSKGIRNISGKVRRSLPRFTQRYGGSHYR